MITFKEFITEGFLADLSKKLLAVQTEIAEDLGARRYKVMVKRGVDLGTANGIHVTIAVPIPKDFEDDQAFFETMVEKSVKKAMGKQFDRFKLRTINNTSWDNGGRAIYILSLVPDADGMFEDVNTQP